MWRQTAWSKAFEILNSTLNPKTTTETETTEAPCCTQRPVQYSGMSVLLDICSSIVLWYILLLLMKVDAEYRAGPYMEMEGEWTVHSTCIGRACIGPIAWCHFLVAAFLSSSLCCLSFFFYLLFLICCVCLSSFSSQRPRATFFKKVLLSDFRQRQWRCLCL